MPRKQILKVLVGSQAHGLADKDSDYDYRAVYVDQTSEILSLGHKYKGSDWIEGKEDNTSYEIGHFLQLATRCNPTILEVFMAPEIRTTEDGKKLQELFQYVWNPKDSFNAFVGYAHNQRKKMIDKKSGRQDKFSVAYIRTLINLIFLLHSKSFDLKVKTAYKSRLLQIRQGKWSAGKVLDWADKLQKKAFTEYQNCNQVQSIDKVNEFLLDIRKRYW